MDEWVPDETYLEEDEAAQSNNLSEIIFQSDQLMDVKVEPGSPAYPPPEVTLPPYP